MNESPDTEVWDYARQHGFTIVSKDADFHQRSLLLAPPPKVVWLRLGNCSVAAVERLVREHLAVLAEFERDPEAAFVILA